MHFGSRFKNPNKINKLVCLDVRGVFLIILGISKNIGN